MDRSQIVSASSSSLGRATRLQATHVPCRDALQGRSTRPAHTNPSRSRNATALRSTGRHVYPWLAICCNMHARTHAHPWMASASFGRSGPAMRVLRTVARRQKRPGNVKRAPASVSCTYHTRRGLCQDLRGAWSSQRTLPWPLLSLPRQLQETCYRSTAASDHFVFD